MECQNWKVLIDHCVPHKETGPEWAGDLGQVIPGALPSACCGQTLPQKRVPAGAVFGSWSLGKSQIRSSHREHGGLVSAQQGPF